MCASPLLCFTCASSSHSHGDLAYVQLTFAYFRYYKYVRLFEEFEDTFLAYICLVFCNEEASPSAVVRLPDVFLIIFEQQQRSMAQMSKTIQAGDRQTPTVSRGCWF